MKEKKIIPSNIHMFIDIDIIYNRRHIFVFTLILCTGDKK